MEVWKLRFLQIIKMRYNQMEIFAGICIEFDYLCTQKTSFPKSFYEK